MKSAIIATIMVLGFASTVEAQRNPNGRPDGANRRPDGGNRRPDGGNRRPKTPFVGCRMQAENIDSSFQGQMSFRTKTDQETGTESIGQCAGVRGLEYDANEISIDEGLNSYYIDVYQTFAGDVESAKEDLANGDLTCADFATGTLFELGQIDISEEGRGFVREQDISAAYGLDWTLETSANRLAAVTNSDAEIIGCCFLGLVEPEVPEPEDDEDETVIPPFVNNRNSNRRP